MMKKVTLTLACLMFASLVSAAGGAYIGEPANTNIKSQSSLQKGAIVGV